ncbi:MAG TPA: hypothetical protein VD735_04075 [Candidatus Saccharimonadales bacterium]|nr:hypothetical protein [Candidatus Saccharimonadales bacterium]
MRTLIEQQSGLYNGDTFNGFQVPPPAPIEGPAINTIESGASEWWQRGGYGSAWQPDWYREALAKEQTGRLEIPYAEQVPADTNVRASEPEAAYWETPREWPQLVRPFTAAYGRAKVQPQPHQEEQFSWFSGTTSEQAIVARTAAAVGTAAVTAVDGAPVRYFTGAPSEYTRKEAPAVVAAAAPEVPDGWNWRTDTRWADGALAYPAVGDAEPPLVQFAPRAGQETIVEPTLAPVAQPERKSIWREKLLWGGLGSIALGITTLVVNASGHMRHLEQFLQLRGR